MDNQKSVLFYLSTCPTCNKFMSECQKYNILKNFQLIKIDGNIDYYKQKGLTIVPTIKVVGYSKSFMGSECFEWLNSIIESINQQKLNQPIDKIKDSSNNTNKKITLPPIVGKTNETKSLNEMGYRPSEMNGISDTYAYKDIDTAFPMSFQSRNLNTEIYTPPIEKNKIEKGKQSELIKKMELMRNNDKNEFIKNAEQERNNIIN
jgi:hypothetical protein